MKIAIVVHGRFYAFDLARSLRERGHDVTVFTNYPRWATRKFGLQAEQVRSCWPLGVLQRVVARLGPDRLLKKLDPFWHTAFGKWAAREVSRESWDVVHEFSGIGEEVIRATRGKTKH